MAENIIEGVQRQCNRVRDLIPQYESLPNGAGSIAVALMRASIQLAEQAIASGDVTQMIGAYRDLEGYE